MGYIILDVAGKWYSTADSYISNGITINEAKAFDSSGAAITLTAPESTGSYGGNWPIGSYWDDTVNWGRTFLVNGNTDYASGTLICYGFTNSCDETYFQRIAIGCPSQPASVVVSVGGMIYRLPKKISAYYCESFTVAENLTGRQDTGLTFLGAAIVDKNLSSPVNLLLRQPILNLEGATFHSISNSSVQASQLQGSSIFIQQGQETQRRVDGSLFNKPVIGEREKLLLSGNSFSLNPFQRSARVYSGGIIGSLLEDDTANHLLNLLVTPTHQHLTQAVSVKCTAPYDIAGKYKLSIGENTVVPETSEDTAISNIMCELNPELLSYGLNNALLDITTSIGKKMRVPFTITKEEVNRTHAERTFMHYDGGYDGEAKRQSLWSSGLRDCFTVPRSQTSTVVKTTEKTRVNFNSSSGIKNVCVDAHGALFLVSFDQGLTWKSCVNEFWQDVNISDISLYGMTSETINGLSEGKWQEGCSGKSVDFAVYLNNSISDFVITDYATKVAQYKISQTSVRYDLPSNLGATYVSYSVIGDTNGSGSPGSFSMYYSGSWHAIASTTGGQNGNFTYGEVVNNRPTSFSLSYGGVYSSNYQYLNVWAAPYTAYLRSISITMIPNSPPSFNNITLTPEVIHIGAAQLTGSVVDTEGDPVSYRVTINDTNELVPWTELSAGPKSIDITIPAELSPVGSNTIKLESFDGITYGEPKLLTLIRSNSIPAISGVMTGDMLLATIGDADNDTVRYRVLVNGEVKQEWSDYMSSPATVNYRVAAQDVLYGVDNTIVIEAEDSMLETGSCSFPFVGDYYNLMFTDKDGNYYSSSQGTTIKSLDLGNFLINNSSEIYSVILKNTTGLTINDITVTANGTSGGVKIKYGSSRFGFEGTDIYTVPVTMGHGDTHEFFIKAYCSDKNSVGNNIINLIATGQAS